MIINKNATVSSQDSRKEINVELYYKKYGPMVFRRCLDLLKEDDQAYDAMHEVFFKLLKNLDKLEGKYPSSLMYRMATNVCINKIQFDRKFTNEPPDDLLAQIAYYDESEKNYIISELLDHIFNQEKRSTREIAVLFYVDGLTLKEVSKEVGMSISGIRKRLRTLKLKLNQGE